MGGKYKELSEIMNNFDGGRGALPKPIGTGLANMNSELDGGLYPGLSIVGAAPDMGQLVFLLSLAASAAKKKIPVLIFTAAMTESELLARFISRSTISSDKNGKADRSAAISAGRIMAGLSRSSDKEKLNAAMTLLGELKDSIFTVSGTDCDILEETKAFMNDKRFKGKTEVRPLFVISELDSFRHGGVPLGNAENLSLLSEFALANDICIAAGCTLDIGCWTHISRHTFSRNGIAAYKADYLFALELTAVSGSFLPLMTSKGHNTDIRSLIELSASSDPALLNDLVPAELRKEEYADPRRIDLVVLKRRFGLPNRHLHLDLMVGYNYIMPHIEDTEQRKMRKKCYYNNSNLSYNLILFKSRGSDLGEEKTEYLGTSLSYAKYTLSTSDGKPICFGEDVGRRDDSADDIVLFDYFDVMLLDAVYSITKQNTNADRINFSAIVTMLAGGANARVTPDRQRMIFFSLMKLALTEIEIKVVRRKTETTIAKKPLLPLAKDQTESLRKWYDGYFCRSGEAPDIISVVKGDADDTFVEKKPLGDKERNTFFITLSDDNTVRGGKAKLPLFEFAESVNQVVPYPTGLLDIPERSRNTERFERVKHFLIKRLEWIRYNYSPECKKRMEDLHNILFFESPSSGSIGMFERIGCSVPNVYSEGTKSAALKEVRSIYGMICTILDCYKDIGYIFDYAPYYGKDVHQIYADRSSDTDFGALIGVTLIAEDPSARYPVYVTDPFKFVNWSAAEKKAARGRSADDTEDSGDIDDVTDSSDD